MYTGVSAYLVYQTDRCQAEDLRDYHLELPHPPYAIDKMSVILSVIMSVTTSVNTSVSNGMNGEQERSSTALKSPGR